MIFAVNDVAPTGNFTVGLYQCSGPSSGTTGSAATRIYTAGSLVSGSDGATVSAPAADSFQTAVSADFELPSDGTYAMAVLTTATVATSAAIHVMADLQIHYV